MPFRKRSIYFWGCAPRSLKKLGRSPTHKRAGSEGHSHIRTSDGAAEPPRSRPIRRRKRKDWKALELLISDGILSIKGALNSKP